MRVTGGEQRGRTLYVPRGLAVRPTTDKIRQSIFNILNYETPDSRTLDLFCGSGALGIEALSRGAGSVVFVDESTTALNALKKNLTALNLQPEIIEADWQVGLKRLIEQNRSFDLIFADPPYGLVDAETIITKFALDSAQSLLAPAGVFIMESAENSPRAKSLKTLKERIFGQTKITFYTHPDKSEKRAKNDSS